MPDCNMTFEAKLLKVRPDVRVLMNSTQQKINMLRYVCSIPGLKFLGYQTPDIISIS